MTVRSPGTSNNLLLKQHALASGIMAFTAGVVIFLGDFNFPRIIGVLTFFASAAYLSFYLLFDRLRGGEHVYTAGVLLSQLGVVVVTVAILCSGGIVSPFIFLYFSMAVAESLYGLGNPYTLPVSLAGYLLVATGHFFGFLPNIAPWSREVYRFPYIGGLIVILTCAYLALTSRMSARILAVMRAKLNDEANAKEALVRRFSELNATTQLGVLAHRIAHDLRGPIASISGYLEMQTAREKDPEELETLASVQETVDMLVQSLHNITRFGKPGGQTMERIHLREFIRDLLVITSFSQKAKGVTFDVSAPETPVFVSASKSDLQQAFFNILKNSVDAVSANRGPRTVEISLRVSGDQAEVDIVNNGPRIPGEILDTLFKKAVTTKDGGTGVGMLISHGLLAKNGGTLAVRNLDGAGVKFTAVLPLWKEPPAGHA